jgi:GTPase SAR1 family protein
MGNIFGNLFTGLFGEQEIKTIMLGLDFSGKTTILFKMKYGVMVHTIPTMSFNIDTVEYMHVKFNIMDICSKIFMRAFWSGYLDCQQVIIYVVDSSDRERIDQVKEEIGYILKVRGQKNTVLLIYANKQVSVFRRSIKIEKIVLVAHINFTDELFCVCVCLSLSISFSN